MDWSNKHALLGIACVNSEVTLSNYAIVDMDMVREQRGVKSAIVRDKQYLLEMLAQHIACNDFHQSLHAVTAEGAEWLVQEQKTRCGTEFAWKGCNGKSQAQC